MMPILKWLDLRRLGFAAIFLSFLMLLQLIDPDYFWHLRTGQYLFEHGILPSGDIFSYTHPGRPWILHEWLFELVLYAIYQPLGEFGVKLLVSALATAALMVSYGTANKILGKPYVAFVIALVFFVLIKIGVSPRPQLLTFLFFALYLRVLLGFKYFGENRGLLALPLLMVPWVNFHGGYFIGLGLLALFTACEWTKHLACGNASTEQRKRLQWLSLIFAATLLSSLINPYTYHHLLYPFQVMGMEASRSYITEWHSPDFHAFQYQLYLVLVLVFFVATIYRKNRADITELAVPLFFVMMGFLSVRHVPLAAIVLIPFMANAFSQQPLAQMVPARWLTRCSAWYGRHARKGKDLGDKEYLLNWLLLALVAAGLLLYAPIHDAKGREKANAMVPVKATDFIKQVGITGRMFTTYHYGGYLIYRLYPEQKVFIDGRADMYGDAFIKEYIDINSGKANWKPLFDKYKIDYVLVQRDTPLRQILLARGDFKLVYDDETNSVLVREEPQFAGIIAKFGKQDHAM